MMSSRSPLPSRICRARIAHGLVSLGFSLALVLLGAAPGVAQMETKNRSLASGARGLSRPVFRHQTPVYAPGHAPSTKAPAPSSPRSKAAPLH